MAFNLVNLNGSNDTELFNIGNIDPYNVKVSQQTKDIAYIYTQDSNSKIGITNSQGFRFISYGNDFSWIR